MFKGNRIRFAVFALIILAALCAANAIGSVSSELLHCGWNGGQKLIFGILALLVICFGSYVSFLDIKTRAGDGFKNILTD